MVFELLLSVRFSCRNDGERARRATGPIFTVRGMVFGLTGSRQGSRIRKSRPFLDTMEISAAEEGVGFMASVLKN